MSWILLGCTLLDSGRGTATVPLVDGASAIVPGTTARVEVVLADACAGRPVLVWLSTSTMSTPYGRVWATPDAADSPSWGLRVDLLGPEGGVEALFDVPCGTKSLTLHFEPFEDQRF